MMMNKKMAKMMKRYKQEDDDDGDGFAMMTQKK